jgi:hypothetical protein
MQTYQEHFKERTKAPYKVILAVTVFILSYLMTITVNAQDAIQLNANNGAVVTGTIIEADENFIRINAAGATYRLYSTRWK